MSHQSWGGGVVPGLKVGETPPLPRPLPVPGPMSQGASELGVRGPRVYGAPELDIKELPSLISVSPRAWPQRAPELELRRPPTVMLPAFVGSSVGRIAFVPFITANDILIRFLEGAPTMAH